MVQESSDKAKEVPCRVCDQFKTWTKKESKQEKIAAQKDSSNEATKTQNSLANLAKEKEDAFPVAYSACPPDSQELGRSTWTFLHTMAAYYPATPTEIEKDNMRTFINSFKWVYPCGPCASHLRKEIRRDPPKVDSNLDLSLWFCYTHNKVNKILGKPEFDCSRVLERWRDGPSDGRCDWGMPEE
ncbi:FAD-linked sulfhydryl oxidase ALR [Smittium mucronatum]|uniref:Sulfhydryl oxidase n=1 Tax=Smittium mucronatum TaxID=133383 RepID=A0A1R0H0W9_9FUNG|nr:FAD-linked sulfhydryl oxidase ALR [Smittium mucronatum]